MTYFLITKEFVIFAQNNFNNFNNNYRLLVIKCLKGEIKGNTIDQNRFLFKKKKK